MMRSQRAGIKTGSLALLLAALAGCAHAHALAPPSPKEEQHFNGVVQSAKVTLEKTDGSEVVVVGPVLKEGFIRWRDDVTKQAVELPYSEIREVRFRSGSRGSRQGFLIGTVLGLAFSTAAAASATCSGDVCSDAFRAVFFLYTVPAALIGYGLGSFGGAERFTFTHR